VKPDTSLLSGLPEIPKLQAAFTNKSRINLTAEDAPSCGQEVLQ
jgi:hypothetical protein